MTTYHPHHRSVLLEAGYALEHLVWSYRSELDRTPTFAMTADDICLNDFATRTSSLVRSLLEEDGRRQGPKLQFKPPPLGEHGRRLRAAIEARRQALAASARASASLDVPPSATIESSDAAETLHEPPEANPDGLHHQDVDGAERETVRSRRRPR